MACFCPRKCLLGVRTMGDVIWGKYSPKTPKKGAWIGSFKPKRQNLYIAISPERLIRRSSDLRTEFGPRKALRGWSAITPKQIQHGWRPPSWKSIWRHISAANVPIWTKFGSRMQNDTPITAKWSRSKPEVEFQYGGRLYFETGSSYISAANWDIWTKFGLLNFAQIGAPTAELWRHIHFWIWRPRPLNTTSGFVFVDVTAFRKSISKPNFQMIKNNMQITANWSRSKPEVEFQYGGRLYIKNESNYISAANWDISTKFCLLIDFDVLKAVTSTNTKPEVVFSGRGRHLRNR